MAALLPFASTLAASSAADPLPRSLLVLEQSDVRGAFYASIFAGLRSEVNASAKSPVTIYTEYGNLSRFNGPECEASLGRHFQVNYRGRLIPWRDLSERPKQAIQDANLRVSGAAFSIKLPLAHSGPE
jgi:hypothetical protein